MYLSTAPGAAEESGMKPMAVGDEDFDDTDPDYCGRCDGEGYVYGEEIASAYDYGWIDEDGFYPCPECHHRRGLDAA